MLVIDPRADASIRPYGRQENRNKNVRHMHDVADILFYVLSHRGEHRSPLQPLSICV